MPYSGTRSRLLFSVASVLVHSLAMSCAWQAPVRLMLSRHLPGRSIPPSHVMRRSGIREWWRRCVVSDNTFWRVFSASDASAGDHDAFVARMLSLVGDPLEQDGGKIVVFRGNPGARLMVIGEAPGAEEDRLGKPFVGRSGQLLDEILGAVGLDPDRDVYISNIVRRRPPNNRTPTPEELAFYLPMLLEEIRLVNPDIIITLGASSTKALLPHEARGITKTRGKWVPNKELLEIHEGALDGKKIMPWFHPSYLIRNAGERSKQEGGVRWLTREDLREVKRMLEVLNT